MGNPLSDVTWVKSFGAKVSILDVDRVLCRAIAVRDQMWWSGWGRLILEASIDRARFHQDPKTDDPEDKPTQ